MKSIDEAGVEWYLSHPDADKEETWKAGAKYVLEQIESILPFVAKKGIIYGKIKETIEQLKK